MRGHVHIDHSVTDIAESPHRLTANSVFLRFWIGQVATALGNGVSQLAMPLLVLALMNSPAQAGFVAAARTAPYLLLGLPAGALVDRWDRRKLLILCDGSRGLSMASIPIAWSLGILTFWQLIAVALIHGGAVTFANLAQTAALPRLVRREQIPHAQALNVSSQGVAGLIGPGLGGLIIASGSTTAEGAVLACVVETASYLVSFVTLSSIRRPFQGARATIAGRMKDEIVEGLRYVWTDKPIRLLAIVNMLHRLCFGPVIILSVVVFAQTRLKADPAAIGFIIGAAGAGGLIGSLMTPRLRRVIPVGWHMIAVVIAHGIGIGIVSLSDSMVATMIGMLFVGGGEAMTGIVQVSYRLATIPDSIQGRVNSVYRLGSFGAMTFGTSIAGLLLENTGARVTLTIMAAYVIAVGIGTASSEVRRL